MCRVSTPAGGPGVAGKSVADAGVNQELGMHLASIERAGVMLADVDENTTLEEGDRLFFVGVISSVRRFSPRTKKTKTKTKKKQKQKAKQNKEFLWSP